MELSNYLVSWVVSYLGDLQPTYIGVKIYLLSTMDIPVILRFPWTHDVSPEQPLTFGPFGSAAAQARNGQCQVGQPLASRLGETVQKDVPVNGFGYRINGLFH